MSERLHEAYLGDGAYVCLTPWGDVVIYTTNGVARTNEVVLEPSVLSAFEDWLRARRAEVKP